jgi:hypothetical protein
MLTIAAKPIYWAQVQLGIGYFEVERTLVTKLSKYSQVLHHELIRFDPVPSQHLSVIAVEIMRAVDAGQLPPRVAATRQHHACRFYPFPHRCWSAPA